MHKNKTTSVSSVTNDRQSRKCNPLPIKKNSSVRRSLSAGPPCRSAVSNDDETKNFRRVQSVSNFKVAQHMVIKEEEQQHDVDDVVASLPFTPKIKQTPHERRCEFSMKSVKGKEFQLSPLNVYAHTPDIMRKDLSNWLHKRGKSLESFHHLKCFGLHTSNRAYGTVNLQNHKPEIINYRKPETKEVNCGTVKWLDTKDNQTSNSEPHLTNSDEACSYNNHTGSGTSEENKENIYVSDPNLIVPNAVKDLLNVINLGYPWGLCEEWLTMICRLSPGVKEMPVYWECLAALEGVRGDFKSAVDCYERAIIQGASPTNVGESLDQLMEKFNMLNLDCEFRSDRRKSVKTPRAQTLDARNIFKSRVIRFALQEKDLKASKSNIGVEVPSTHYIVTPVRRSTRTSLSQYRTTPGLQCVDSLSQLEPSVRESMVFHPNHAFYS